jgi:hypothetical protein
VATAAAKAEAKVDPLDAFVLRCEARAILVEACAMDLQEAVDGLWEAAERDGLVERLGQDQVQKILSDAFSKVR